jgi:hypothetical protein
VQGVVAVCGDRVGVKLGVSLVTSMVTLVSMWAAGNGKAWSWAMGVWNQLLWFVFIVAFGAWGLLPLNLALVVIYSRNWVKWKTEIP